MEYLKENDTIGITACSCGILDKVDRYESAVKNFKDKGFNIIDTPNVKTNGCVSSDASVRWEEFKSLLLNKDVKMINIVAGGDFLYEMLDYVDYDLIKDNYKLIGGSSDPTSLLFTITTKLDLKTIYTPANICGFCLNNLDSSLENYFKIIKGEKIKQEKFLKYEEKSVDDYSYNLDTDNEWININGDVNESGIIIGGCIECLKDIIGTRYDNVSNYLEKHKDEGIIWYFDVFAMGSEALSNTLRQFNNAGWFKYTKCILIGKVKYKPDYMSISYEDAIKRCGIDLPIVYKFDIGHVKPSFTIINGSYVNVVSNNKEGYLEIVK